VEEFATAAQWFLQQAGAIELQDVENNAGDGDFILKKKIGLLASAALLE
jgi:hypothetical protein